MRSVLLAAAAVIVILLGVFFRFYHVEQKSLSDDEAVTMMHIVGSTEGEAVSRSPELKHVADLQAILHPSAGLKPLTATIETLRDEDPQHPPAYYMIARVWVGMFGTSRAVLRTLSVIVGLLALPCMYWLCMELFAAPAAAWCGVALLAVSPVNVLYAQEIREYGLWLVALLASSALYIRALRSGSIAAWAAYAVVLGFSLYTYPVSLLIALAHGIVAVAATTTVKSRVRALLAVAVGLMLFLPWLWVIATHLGQVNRGMAVINSTHQSPFGVLRAFLAEVRLDSFDLNGAWSGIGAVALLGITAVAVYAVYEISRFGSSVTRWFIWSLLLCTTLPFVGLDLLGSGQRTATTRYFIPLFVALDLALVALMHSKVVEWNSHGKGRRQFWVVVFALILAVRIGSCAADARAMTWWTKYNIRPMVAAARINAGSHPLIISDNYLVWSLVISEYTDPAVAVALAPRCYLCEPTAPVKLDLEKLVRPGVVDTVFLLGASRSLSDEVNQIVRDDPQMPRYQCIEIRGECAGELSLW